MCGSACSFLVPRLACNTSPGTLFFFLLDQNRVQQRVPLCTACRCEVWCSLRLLHSLAAIVCCIRLLHSLAAFACCIRLLHSLVALYRNGKQFEQLACDKALAKAVFCDYSAAIPMCAAFHRPSQYVVTGFKSPPE